MQRDKRQQVEGKLRSSDRYSRQRQNTENKEIKTEARRNTVEGVEGPGQEGGPARDHQVLPGSDEGEQGAEGPIYIYIYIYTYYIYIYIYIF